MADEKIKINVEVVDNFIAAKKNVEHWKKELKKAEDEVVNNQEQIRQITADLAKANQQYESAEKALNKAAKSEEFFNNVTKKTNQSLEEMKQELTALQNIPFDMLDSKQIEEVNQQIADLEVKIKDFQDEINNLKPGGTWKEAAVQFGVLNTAISGVSNTFKLFGIETGKAFQTFQEKAQQVQSIVSAVGTVTEALNSSTLKLIATTIKNTAITISDGLAKKKNALEATKLNLAENASVLAKAKLAISTKLVTAAQWLWNAAMSANPVFLLITGVGALVGVIALLSKAFKKQSEEEKAAAEATKAYEEQSKATNDAITEIDREQKKLEREKRESLKETIEDMRAKGKTEQEIAEITLKAEQEIRKSQKKASEDREAELKKQEKSIADLIAKEEAQKGKLKEGSKAYKEQEERIKELNAERDQLLDKIDNEVTAQGNLTNQIKQANDKYNADIEKAEQERIKKSQDRAKTSLDRKKKIQDEEFKQEQANLEDSFDAREDFEKRKFAAEQQYQKDSLALQRDSKEISEDEYQHHLTVLAMQENTFNQNQLNARTKYTNSLIEQQKKEQKELLALVGQGIEERQKELDREYEENLKKFDKSYKPQQKEGQTDEEYQNTDAYKDYMRQQADFEKTLKAQTELAKTKIQQDADKLRATIISDTLKKDYQKKLAMYTDNEREKNRQEMEMLEEQIQQKKDAELSVYEDEAKLRALQAKENQIAYNQELLDSDITAKKKYEAKKAYLTQELKIWKGNKEKEAEIMKQMEDNEKDLLDKRMEMFKKFADSTKELMSGMDELFSAIEARQMEQYTADNNKKKTELKTRLDQGLISQKEYDAGVAAADKELDNKKAEIARKQAMRDKAIKIFDVTTGTAVAIVSALKAGPIAGPIMAAIIGALGAVQIATVLATPLPKASRGMLLNGPSHARGGIPIEAEGGEAIINKRSTSMFAPLLSAINMAGGGVPFAAPMSDGGYSSRTAISGRGMTEAQMENAMMRAVSNTKVYVALDDFHEADSRYTEITQSRGF